MPADFRDTRDAMEDEVRRVPLPPAAEIRAKGRRRRTRQRAAVAGSVVALAAVVVAGTQLPGLRPAETVTPGIGFATSAAGPSGCAEPVDLSLPNRPGDVDVRIVDATGRDVAEEVAKDLRDRDFPAKILMTAHELLGNQQVGEIRYGPLAVGDATLIQAYLLGQAEPVFEPDRADATIDLVVGPAFQQFGTPTEVNQSLAFLGQDAMPHDC
jgi:hypothetical protein